MTSSEAEPEKTGGLSGRAIRILRATQLPFYVGPVTIWAMLFMVFPLLIVLYYSFLSTDVFGIIQPGFSLENYKFITEPRLYTIVLRSFSYTIFTTVTCLVIGYAVAYWIAVYGGRWRLYLLFLIILPEWTAYLIRLYAMRNIIGRNGVLNSFLMEFNIISEPLEILYTPFAVLLGLVYTWLPFTILPLYATLMGLDPAMLKAASDLGAPPLQRFLKVTLPLTKGGLFAALILVAIPSLGEWVVPQMLGGNKLMLIGSLIEFRFNIAADIPGGSAVALFLLVVVFILFYLILKWGGEEVLERML